MRTLDRRINIERKSVTRDSYGQEVETWTAIAENWHAAVSPISGDERFSADQFIARQQVEFRIRYSSDVSDVTPLDRIIYPLSDDSPLPEGNIYDIMDVSELGRREGLLIKAARRSE